ncbi:hypothetical protein KC320_g209 [Hortaea werneckii]|nr:hypothetical protein KC320_g209 [Hortaea werneckii]
MYRVFTYILCLVRLRSSVLFGALDLVQRSHELKDTPTGKMPVENPNPKSGQESKHLVFVRVEGFFEFGDPGRDRLFAVVVQFQRPPAEVGLLEQDGEGLVVFLRAGGFEERGEGAEDFREGGFVFPKVRHG